MAEEWQSIGASSAHLGAQDLAKGRDEELLALRCLLWAIVICAAASCGRSAGCRDVVVVVSMVVTVVVAASALFMTVIAITCITIQSNSTYSI